MREKLTNNIGLKILSIILAALVWVGITNIDNPVSSKRFKDVPVQIINDNILKESDQVYDVLQGETIDFTIEGRRTIIDEINLEDFAIKADFNLVSAFDTIQIEISSPKYGDRVQVIDGKHQMMKISREQSIEEKFKVDVHTIGNVMKGYYIGKTIASPNIVSVSGPKARVEAVKNIIVEVGVARASDSFSLKAAPQAIDSDGNVINDVKLELSENHINVDVSLFRTKEIRLIMGTEGNVKEGYVLTGIEYEPKTIIIAGDNQAFIDLNYLTINEDIEGIFANIEKAIELQDYLPEGIVLAEDKVAVLKVNIEQKIYQTIDVFPSGIKIDKNPEEFKVEYPQGSKLTLSITGLEEDIKKALENEMEFYIELDGLSEGSQEVGLKMKPLNGVELVDSPKISLKLIK